MLGASAPFFVMMIHLKKRRGGGSYYQLQRLVNDLPEGQAVKLISGLEEEASRQINTDFYNALMWGRPRNQEEPKLTVGLWEQLGRPYQHRFSTDSTRAFLDELTNRISPVAEIDESQYPEF